MQRPETVKVSSAPRPTGTLRLRTARSCRCTQGIHRSTCRSCNFGRRHRRGHRDAGAFWGSQSVPPRSSTRMGFLSRRAPRRSCRPLRRTRRPAPATSWDSQSESWKSEARSDTRRTGKPQKAWTAVAPTPRPRSTDRPCCMRWLDFCRIRTRSPHPGGPYMSSPATAG